MVQRFKRLTVVLGITLLFVVLFQVLIQMDLPEKTSDPYVSNRISAEDCLDRMKKRIDHLEKLCKKFHLGVYKGGTTLINVKDPPTLQYSYFYLNKKHSMAWCPVYKAGSTSWLFNMMLLAGHSEDQLNKEIQRKQLSILAREIYGEPSYNHDFLRSIKMLIVRDPFTRIISAYRDKLSNSSQGHEHGTAHFYKVYGKRIVEKFRIDHSINQIEPTFEEFVRYLIHTDLALYADDHWLPVYYSCTPCLVPYTFIAKVETYNEDQDCIIDQLNLSSILKSKWIHKTTSSSHSEESSFMSKYIGTLSKVQINQLYEKYKLDFLLFDYDYLKYLEYAE